MFCLLYTSLQPQVQVFDGDGVAADEGGIADFFRPLRSTAKKGINPCQAGAGNDVFSGHPAILVEQPAPQFALLGGLRRKAHVAAFAGDDAVAIALPDQPGDTEPGAGAENDARRMVKRLAGVQRDDAFGFNQCQAVGGLSLIHI